MQPYPRSLDLVWPGHVNATGCLSVRAIDTGFPTVVWRTRLVLGLVLSWPLLVWVSGLVRVRIWVSACLLAALAGACGVCGWMWVTPAWRLLRLGFDARVFGCGYEGRGVAPFVSGLGLRFVPCSGLGRPLPLLGWVCGWRVWVGVLVVCWLYCSCHSVFGSGCNSPDARLSAGVSLTGVCSPLVWAGRSPTGPGQLPRLVWRSFFDLGGFFGAWGI